ncbi:putative membrane protein [Pedobacter cryoconitis]|uniref:Putative membrane protein n=1 Tax=Pedobacter cryoconitis TaxID=188932 RepID=A0A7W9E1B4_9SPHI|nr:hypothetical protein [Pedobacter cryoconitis]MBB5638169.1 putative membrane protein [Pedobacter cryoconitis]
MKSLKILKLLLTFYLSILVTTIALFLIGLLAYHFMGVEFLPVIIWFKVITLGIIGYYISNYKKREVYCYQNSGLPKIFLWVCTFSFDLSLFVALLILMKS